MVIKVNKIRLKFAGYLALVMTMMGLFLAAGGQLNFFGNARSGTVVTTSEKKIDLNKPKYSFYDELKKRKIEIDNAKQEQFSASTKSKKQKGAQRHYVVQIGAFLKKMDANLAQKKAERFGYATRIIKAGSRFLLQTGPYVGKEKAFDIEKQLKVHGFDTLVKPLK